MDFIQAIVLGIVQGLTEFLPISSSGHLLLVPALLHWKDAGTGFTAVIQLGTVLATWIYFRDDLKNAVTAWYKSIAQPELRKTTDARIGWGVFFGTLPIVFLGLPIKKWAEIHGFDRNIQLTAILLIVMGIVLFVADRFFSGKRNRDSFRPMDGVWMGIWQACALFPGASRSGSTMTGGFFLGLDRTAAARVSFLLSIPSVTAAGLYELFKARKELLDAGIGQTLVSTAVSFVVGYIAVAYLIKFLQTQSTLVFTIYRVILGVVILVLFAQGTIQNPEPEVKSKPAVTSTSHPSPTWPSSVKSRPIIRPSV